MIRSLYSGVSGLKSHQTKMDVIGNNISNVNTTAFKSKSINFSDMLYQTTQGATAPNPEKNIAGINPRQIGLGVKTAAISSSITTEGSTQTTGNPFDLKLTGEAFFIVNDGTNTYFTRDGAFAVDAAGYLAMSGTGYNVMGWTNIAEDGSVIKDNVKPIKVLDAASKSYDAAATTQAYIAGILDKNDKNLETDDGKITTLQIYDKRGYAYNLRMGIKPATGQTVSTKNITNIERKYNLPAKLYKIDNSVGTFKFADGSVVTSTDMPEGLYEALMQEASVKRGTTLGVDTTVNANTIGITDATSLDAFLTAKGITLDSSSDIYKELAKGTFTVDFKGATAYSTDGTRDGIIDISDAVADTLGASAVSTSTLTNPDDSTVTPTGIAVDVTDFVVTQKIPSDDSGTTYSLLYKKNGTDTSVDPMVYEDWAKLLAYDMNPAKIAEYTTTENITKTEILEGQYQVSLLSMTDSENKNVDITNLNNPVYNLVYNTADGSFNYVGAAGSKNFTLNLSQLGDNFENLTVDMSTSKNVDNNGSSTISGTSGDLDGNNAGRKVGELTGVSISTDGMIYATYSNSQTRVLGQIAVATFANASGLANVGDNCYESTQNSGAFDGIGVDIKASGTGYMTSGCLEMSNVDLSNEFTNMITTQRGFQANSRIITVSDTLLEELTNLKR